MESMTTLANQALGLIAEKPIDSYDNSDTQPARACRLHAPQAIREVQSEFPWRELVRHWGGAAAAPAAVDSHDGLPRYQLPQGLLYLVRPSFDYRLEGAFLVTAEPAPEFDYVLENQNPAEFSVELFKCCYYALGVKLARALAQSQSMAQGLEETYRGLILGPAKTKQAYERQPRSYMPRRGGRYTMGRRV